MLEQSNESFENSEELYSGDLDANDNRKELIQQLLLVISLAYEKACLKENSVSSIEEGVSEEKSEENISLLEAADSEAKNEEPSIFEKETSKEDKEQTLSPVEDNESDKSGSSLETSGNSSEVPMFLAFQEAFAPSQNKEKAQEDDDSEEDESLSLKNPSSRGIESLQHFFGSRKIEPFDNSEILRSRLLYQVSSSKIKHGTDIFNKNTGKKVGTAGKMQIRHSWRMANSRDAHKAVKNKLFFMTYEEWAADCNKLEKYILSRRNNTSDTSPVLFEEVWKLSEMEYLGAGLVRPQKFMALLQTAILGEIAENRRLTESWNKIKKYSHRVPLYKSGGGIFSDEDAYRISWLLNIKYLNDIKRFDIYTLKSLTLEYNFERIIADINRAYKEDLARRKDFRYKVHPFVAVFINLAALIYIAYEYGYTLIKSTNETYLIMALLSLCVFDAFIMLIGGLRALIRRRRSRPEYIYCTKNVKRAISLFASVGLFVVMWVFVLYQRYDGYNDFIYYRDCDDGTISIAGLRDEYETNLVIPETIDGKTVSKVALFAFYNDSIQTLELPATITKIEKGAFYQCYSLYRMTIPSSVTEIETLAFYNCQSLTNAIIPSGVGVIEKDTFKKSGLTRLEFAMGASVAIEEEAFNECLYLSTIINMGAVTSIGDKAFNNCGNLGSFELSDGLTSIGKKAFYNCNSMSKLVVPASCQTIGKKAFYYCDAIENLTIPYAGTSVEESKEQNIGKIVKFTYPQNKKVTVTFNSSNSIAPKAFKNAAWIYALILDDGITEIGNGAFANTPNLVNVKMSAGVTHIYDSMFENSASITTITGMQNVKSVGVNAFANCVLLSSVDFTELESIGDRAFSSCASLYSLGNLSSLKNLGAEAFYSCQSLMSIGELSSLETIGAKAFAGCYSLTGEFRVPSSLHEISDYAFANSYFSKITCDEGLNKIGAYAFESCTNLSEFTMPSTIATVGEYAFKDCIALRALHFENTALSSLGKAVFYDCASLITVSLATPITIIPEYTFYGCSEFNGLESITNLSSLAISGIGESAFESCSILHRDVVIPEGVTSIGKRAFANTVLTSVKIPESVLSIGENAFDKCPSIKSAELHFLGKSANDTNNGYTWVFGNSMPFEIKINGMQSVTNQVFAGAESFIESLVFGDALTVIEAGAFANFKNLRSVSMPDTVSYIGPNAFENCEKLTDINIPSSLNEISVATFKNCKSLKTIDFKSLKVKIIRSEAFMGSLTGQKEIEFNDGLVSVEMNAFASCTSIKTLIFGNSMTGVDVNAFGENPKISINVYSQKLHEQYTKLFETYKNVTITLVKEN